MLPLFLVSSHPYTGKNFLTLGLALNLKERGYKIGYIHPAGKLPVKKGKAFFDEEALFIKELLELDDPPEVVSPFVYTYDFQYQLFEEGGIRIKERVIEAINSLKDRDFVFIVCGDTPFEGYLIDIHPGALLKEVKGRVLAVQLWRGDTTLDDLFGLKEIFGKYFLGAVLNKVPVDYYLYVKENMVPFAASRGLKIFGVFKKEKALEAVTVKTILEVVNGGIVCGEDKLEEFVENFAVGAMDPENALRYFLRTPNKAVITGVHRTDIQLLALETSTKCLLLTGGLVANETVVARAKEKGVPVIVTSLDTFTVVDKIENLIGRAMIREKTKAIKAKEIVEKEFMMEEFLRLLEKEV